MKILVVGGAGYVGSTSVERFVDRGHEVVVFDNLASGHASAVPDGALLVVGDLADRARLRSILSDGVDAVLHCAARSLVGESMENPGLYYRTNVAGGVSLLEAMRDTGVTRLVYSSTAAVYGEPRRVPIAEADRTQPINPYGETKLAFEGAMRWFCAAHGLRAISLRYFNVAGATERNGEDHDPETHLMPLVLRVAAGASTHVQIYGQDYPTPDGTCIRDFVHVRDLAEGHLLALEATGEGDPSLEVYNLGSAAGFSVREVVEAARRVTGRAIPARVLKRRVGDPPVLVASSRRARRELGWQPDPLDPRAHACRRVGVATAASARLRRSWNRRADLTDRAEAGRRHRRLAAPRAAGAQAVEVDPRVIDAESEVDRHPLGDRPDVGLVDLLDPAASVAGEMVVMLRPAGDIPVDVPIELEAPGDAGRDERLERPKDGGAPDARIASVQASVQVLRRDLAAERRQRVRDGQALTGDPLAGAAQPVRGGGARHSAPTAPAKTESA